MAPVAFGFLAELVGTVVVAAGVGVLIGVVVWKLKAGFLWGCLGAALYLVASPPFSYFGFVQFAVLSAPPLMLTFLAGYLSARYLGVRRHVRAVWATLAALVCASAVGWAYISFFTRVYIGL